MKELDKQTQFQMFQLQIISWTVNLIWNKVFVYYKQLSLNKHTRR